MIGRQRKETAVELAASIIALTLGEDVEMTIIVREPGGDDGNITLRSSIDTAPDLAKLLYRVADHLAVQNTAAKER
jgi:hypothetical protein